MLAVGTWDQQAIKPVGQEPVTSSDQYVAQLITTYHIMIMVSHKLSACTDNEHVLVQDREH